MENKDTNKVAKIIILDRGKVLLLMSKHLKKLHLPGGHLVENETFNQGIKRELKEETGLTLSWCKVIFTKPNFTLYRGVAYPSAIKLSDEHDGYIWARIEDAHKYPLCNLTKKFFFYMGMTPAWRSESHFISWETKTSYLIVHSICSEVYTSKQ